MYSRIVRRAVGQAHAVAAHVEEVAAVDLLGIEPALEQMLVGHQRPLLPRRR